MSQKGFALEASARAERELDAIADWYDEHHPGGIDRFFADYEKALNVLATFPYAGRERDELSPGIRSYIVHPYVVFHRVDEDQRKIVIVTVRHGAMDIDADDISRADDTTRSGPS